MSLLKPFSPEEVLEAVAGNAAPKRVNNSNDIKVVAKDILSDEGADVQAAARQLYWIMQNAEKDSDKLRAAELVLKIQGAYEPDKDRVAAGVTINIISSGENQQNLINLVMPQP